MAKMKDVDDPIVDMPTVSRDLYFVMSLLLADEAIAKIPNAVTWTKSFHGNEVRRLLLWIAVSMRSLLDLLDPENTSTDVANQNCGEYWRNFPGKQLPGEQLSLTFRQACNSIIHAQEILLYKIPETEQVTEEITPLQVYIDRLTVRGHYQDKKTRAQLDIILFVQIANQLINLHQEKDNGNK